MSTKNTATPFATVAGFKFYTEDEQRKIPLLNRKPVTDSRVLQFSEITETSGHYLIVPHDPMVLFGKYKFHEVSVEKTPSNAFADSLAMGITFRNCDFRNGPMFKMTINHLERYAIESDGDDALVGAELVDVIPAELLPVVERVAELLGMALPLLEEETEA
jgi:hypothetical protein